MRASIVLLLVDGYQKVISRIEHLENGSVRNMPTLFAVYNLKDKQMTEEYDKYLVETKIPGMRGAPWCTAFNTWKIDKVLAPAVSEPEGELPSESPYMYIAKIEVSDLDAMVNFLGTDEGKKFVQSWSVYLDPKSIFTMGHDI